MTDLHFSTTETHANAESNRGQEFFLFCVMMIFLCLYLFWPHEAKAADLHQPVGFCESVFPHHTKAWYKKCRAFESPPPGVVMELPLSGLPGMTGQTAVLEDWPVTTPSFGDGDTILWTGILHANEEQQLQYVSIDFTGPLSKTGFYFYRLELLDAQTEKRLWWTNDGDFLVQNGIATLLSSYDITIPAGNDLQLVLRGKITDKSGEGKLTTTMSILGSGMIDPIVMQGPTIDHYPSGTDGVAP